MATRQNGEPKRLAPPGVHESPVPTLNLPHHSDNEEDSPVQSYTESARDAELDDADLSEFDISTSLNFDSYSLPIGGVSSIAITPPPPGFRTGYVSGHDTDDDMNSTMDLPDDSTARQNHKGRSSNSESGGTNAAKKFGQALKVGRFLLRHGRNKEM